MRPAVTTRRGAPQPRPETFSIHYFRGVDLANQPANVDSGRSCGGVNMIRDVPGKVRKRMGYHLCRRYPGRINGIWSFQGQMIVHAGDALYSHSQYPGVCGGKDDIGGGPAKMIYTGMADRRSDAKQTTFFEKNREGEGTERPMLWILDGKRFLAYDGERVRAAEDIAYCPTVTIGRAPEGGGRVFEPVNMLSDRRTERFLGTAAATVYQLSFSGIEAGSVSARRRTLDGTFEEIGDFSLDAAAGRVIFLLPPGAPHVSGEDNVEITYAVKNPVYREKINGCRFAVCYGVGGAADRLFISGNSRWGNLDFHSQMNDPSYFADEWYGVLGQRHSPVMGYSVIGDQLAAHKKNDDNGRNVILRRGSLEQTSPEEGGTRAQFRITGIIQGEGAISEYAFGYAKEPIFLTGLGIAAATPYAYNAERYVQNRGFYINGALLREPNLSEAAACVHDDFYMLAVNGRVYILDTLEQAYEKSEQSAYQYEAYLWDNIPARVFFGDGSILYFGTDRGEVMRFFDDAESISSYMDAADPAEPGSGTAIRAHWDFDFSGRAFYRNKAVRTVAVRLAPSVATSVSVFARVRGVWQDLLTIGGEARYFSFSKISFSKFTFSGDSNPRTIVRRIRIKKADAVRFSLRNEEATEPFGIYEIALEYGEGGYYRG